MTNWSSVLWWTYILLLVLQCCHRAHYKWVLNCVATPEIIRGPWSHNCARSLREWHGHETWWSSVCHERPWPELRLSLNDTKGGTRERSHWPAIVFSGGCVPWTSDCCGDWLLLAADVTAGSLEMSQFSDSGLSILLSSIPFGLLESVNLSIWEYFLTVSIWISQGCQALVLLLAVRMRTVIWAALKSLLAEHDSWMESGQIHCYMQSLSWHEIAKSTMVFEINSTSNVQHSMSISY